MEGERGSEAAILLCTLLAHIQLYFATLIPFPLHPAKTGFVSSVAMVCTARNLHPAGARRKECHASRRRKILPHCMSNTRAAQPLLCHRPAPSWVRSWQTWAFERRKEIQKLRICSKQISVLAEAMRALFLSACGKLHYCCRATCRGSVPSVLCSWGEALLNARFELSFVMQLFCNNLEMEYN